MTYFQASFLKSGTTYIHFRWQYVVSETLSPISLLENLIRCFPEHRANWLISNLAGAISFSHMFISDTQLRQDHLREA